ncbi:MAG TPA: ABC transporter permease [Anaerovoracaceae bacterium]|nr:ABC transporter permease [Anaerovoracaceae bacterium]
MSKLTSLVKRNVKLFFKDKGMFFSSLITPLILLVLYATFLAKVYRDSFASAIPKGVAVDQSLIDACAGNQLFASLLAVCCVTVAFCANLIMIQDKVTGAKKDLTIAPVKHGVLAMSYYFATAINTIIIALVTTGVCFIYLANVGWYFTATDILMILLDVFILVLFGTALSSLICYPLSTEGQMSAVGTIVSAGYGFICGAYMPISQFGGGIQKVMSFSPGTYGTSLIRNHSMRGVFEEMENQHLPDEVIEGIKDAFDCNLYFSGEQVGMSTMYAIMAGTIAILIIAYVLINVLRKSR